MLDLYFTIHDETLEVMILDCNVLLKRSHLRSKQKYDCPFIIFVDCDCIFEKTAQNLQGVSLKLEYELNFFHKTYER